MAESAKTKKKAGAAASDEAKAKRKNAKPDEPARESEKPKRGRKPKAAPGDEAKNAGEAKNASPKRGKAKAATEKPESGAKEPESGAKEPDVKASPGKGRGRGKGADKVEGKGKGEDKARTGAKSKTRKTETKTEAETKDKAKTKTENDIIESDSVEEDVVAEIIGGSVFYNLSGSNVYMKTADVCRLFGKSNVWIGRLTAQGVLARHKTVRGLRFELFEAVGAYVKMLSDRAQNVDVDSAEADRQRRIADARWKSAKATVAELEAAELEGKMHRSEDVRAMTEDLIFAVRHALIALPGRLAVDVAACSDAAEASEIIKKEVYEVMKEISSYTYDENAYHERVRERRKLESLQEDGELSEDNI